MKKLIILSIIAVMIFSGCSEKTATDIQANDGNSKKTVTDIQNEGKSTVSEDTGVGADWCKAGTSTTSSSSTAGGQSSTTFVIKGITTYKGRQVCEAETKYTETGSNSFSTTYLYSQDEKYGVWIMKDASGNVISENEVNNP